MRRHLRCAAGYTLLGVCAIVDRIPWHDGRWYLIGQRGCVWGISDLAFRILP